MINFFVFIYFSQIPPLDSHNGVLLGFYIAYRLAGLQHSIFTNIDVKGGEALTYKIVGLPLFTRYEIRIAAYNKAGIGVWSSIHIVETMQGSKYCCYLLNLSTNPR